MSKTNYDSMVQIIDIFSSKYYAKYYNYYYDKRFDINDFWDNDHLNEYGAKKFSIIMKNEIIDKLI